MAVRKVGLVQLKTRGDREATLAEIERLVGEAMGAAVPR
jgi:predicted amidohydrolase